MTVAVKKKVQDTGSPGIGQKLVAVPDQRPGRYRKFDPHPALAFIDQVDHLAFAQRKFFGHHSQKAFFTVDQQTFHGLQLFPLFVTIDNLGPADTKFIALAAHRLDQDRQLKLTPALDQNAVALIGFFNLDGNVDEVLFEQTLPEAAGLDVFSLLACKRGIVDRKFHGNRGFIHPDAR